MDKLLPYVDEFIIVVKYKAKIIKEYFWDEFHGAPIRYHEQWEKYGTGWAITGIDVHSDCFILASDTLYHQRDVDMLAKHEWYAVLCREVENPEKFWTFKMNSQNHVEWMIEKSPNYFSNLANVFYFKLNSEMVTLAEETQISERGEYEITDPLNIFVKKHEVKALKLEHDIQDITALDDLELANTLSKPELWETRYLENIWDYEIHLWIPETGIQEIVNYSTDETDIALREWTSDWKKRFISVENLISWYSDSDRYPFTLLSKDWVVAGLWWGRPAKLPNITEILNQDTYDTLLKNSDNIHTSGIRIYPFARWERLASPFMKACERFYTYIFKDIYMSDDVGAENIPSQRSFERLGYVKIGYGKNVNNSPDSGKKRFVYMKKF